MLADGPGWCRFAAEHGLRFLSTVHWDDEYGAWYDRLWGYAEGHLINASTETGTSD